MFTKAGKRELGPRISRMGTDFFACGKRGWPLNHTKEHEKGHFMYSFVSIRVFSWLINLPAAEGGLAKKSVLISDIRGP
jgi:hypothetical protein